MILPDRNELIGIAAELKIRAGNANQLIFSDT
jgi:hypothetical protein